ncbi:glycosyl transferase [Jannaschia pagri]|uniref:Peptide O-xylosyltransferase n=1 Tax=Jannaschia pagri TaxID=2829797 RepID=A0ABQ4NLL2_9RHOB|nr:MULTISPECIES: beta-1,6-N-acetylglucosaminyltransferase [unclassified Jannaschia]GIT91471.1 glycosyl transferase [Jannaschia sp. AI_61]GIT95305.1 glycosyl transferase [Jannaschia sp. AI_62]
MTLGFVMLVHTAFDRAEQVAQYWSNAGCPVIIHVDGKVTQKVFRAFKARFDGNRLVRFSKRVRVEWGTWSLVEATQLATTRMLDNFPDVRHVYLASGSCLPLRPVGELQEYLFANPETDFIESVTIQEVTWTVDGLEAERFTLRFPFSWRKRRKLFDRYTELQRKLGVRRKLPEGLSPHLGSQWWCLTRDTLEAILKAPDRIAMDRYFQRVWIPDESYFQSLTRRYARRIESRSLTLAKFDTQGKPHIFYDDHVQLLERSDCFVARKIWPQADALYGTFLDPDRPAKRVAEPNPGKIDRVFARANDRRGDGRQGLYNQGRFPAPGFQGPVTCARYNVFSGFADLFETFDLWLARRIGGRVHGRLYHPDRAEFAGEERVLNGCLSDSATLRDYRPQQFLTNLLWSTRGERQTFFYGPGDTPEVAQFMARDPNATICVISGAWAIPLHLSQRPMDEIRSEAARLQRAELAFLKALNDVGVTARVHQWTLADFVVQPMEKLQNIVDEITGPGPRRLTDIPPMPDLSAFPEFLQRLRNEGVKPVVMGDFAATPLPQGRRRHGR